MIPSKVCSGDSCDRKDENPASSTLEPLVEIKEEPETFEPDEMQTPGIEVRGNHVVIHESDPLEPTSTYPDERKPFLCGYCEEAFGDSQSLELHSETHNVEERRSESPNNPPRGPYSGGRPYGCNRCGAGFTERRFLSNHMRIHSEDRPFNCPQCRMRCSRRSDLQKHMRMHRFRPELPAGSLPTQISLRISPQTAVPNAATITPGSSILENEPAGQESRSASQMQPPVKPYVVRYIILPSESPTNAGNRPPDVTVPRPRPFRCAHCGVAYAHKSQLTNHARIHSGVRPFKCDQCRVTCSRKGDLEKHKKVHVKVAKYLESMKDTATEKEKGE